MLPCSHGINNVILTVQDTSLGSMGTKKVRVQVRVRLVSGKMDRSRWVGGVT